MQHKSIWVRYGYLWVTLVLFIGSFIGHWMFAWYAFISEQEEHGAPVIVSEYLVEVTRDTLENWQSEFLQLMWQIAGLSLLLYVGSPQSKESDDRKEEKIDYILKKIDVEKGADVIRELDAKYARK